MLLAAGPKQSISLDQWGGEASVPRLPPHAPPYHLRTKCLIGSHYFSRKKPALLGSKLGSHKMARRWAAPGSQIPEKSCICYVAKAGHLLGVQLLPYGLPDLSPGKGNRLLNASHRLLLNSRQLFSKEKQEASNLPRSAVWTLWMDLRCMNV